MAYNTTYRNTVDLFLNICNSHEQIHSANFGERWQVDENYKESNVFPKAFIQPISSSELDISAGGGNPNGYVHTFKLQVFDILLSDKSNYLEVYSDTQSILYGIVNAIRMLAGKTYFIQGVTTASPFNSRYADDVTGWECNVSVRIAKDSNGVCDEPIQTFVIPSGSGSGGVLISGVQGPQGPQGENGAIGPQGPGGNNTLAQTLAIGNTTDGQYILSNNSFSRLGLFNNQSLLTYQNVGTVANLEHGDYYTQLSYSDGTNSGNFNVQSSMSEIVHSSLISLNAPNVISSATGTNTVQCDNTLYLSKIEIQVKPTKAYVNDYAFNQTTGYNSSIYNEAGATDNIITISSNNPSFAGAQYSADYSTNYTARSLVDKDYVDNNLPALSGTTPIIYNAGNISILQSGLTQSGYLSTTDWNTFNDKLSTATATFMFTGLASYIGGSYLQTVSLPNFSVGATHTVTTSGVSTTPTSIGTFATNLGFPNTTVIPAGTISAHIETKKVAGANNYYVYFELYKRSNVGIETLLVTSDFSTQTAVNTTVQQSVAAFLISNTTILITDTLVIKWYGVMLSSTATLDVYIDDNTNARFELPVTSVDPSIYVPYTNAQADLNINNHKITSLADGTSNNDAVNVGQMNTAIASASSPSTRLFTYYNFS